MNKPTQVIDRASNQYGLKPAITGEVVRFCCIVVVVFDRLRLGAESVVSFSQPSHPSCLVMPLVPRLGVLDTLDV